MPFRQGDPKPPGSGRRKGTRNKLSLAVSERLTELGCDPIEGMAALAMDPRNPVELRGRMYSELAAYCYPKKKSIEHSGPAGGPIETTRALTLADMDALIAAADAEEAALRQSQTSATV
jgi:hypothetical protein